MGAIRFPHFILSYFIFHNFPKGTALRGRHAIGLLRRPVGTKHGAALPRHMKVNSTGEVGANVEKSKTFVPSSQLQGNKEPIYPKYQKGHLPCVGDKSSTEYRLASPVPSACGWPDLRPRATRSWRSLQNGDRVTSAASCHVCTWVTSCGVLEFSASP